MSIFYFWLADSIFVFAISCDWFICIVCVCCRDSYRKVIGWAWMWKWSQEDLHSCCHHRLRLRLHCGHHGTSSTIFASQSSPYIVGQYPSFIPLLTIFSFIAFVWVVRVVLDYYYLLSWFNTNYSAYCSQADRRHCKVSSSGLELSFEKGIEFSLFSIINRIRFRYWIDYLHA